MKPDIDGQRGVGWRAGLVHASERRGNVSLLSASDRLGSCANDEAADKRTLAPVCTFSWRQIDDISM
jgi:hypothetical protein